MKSLILTEKPSVARDYARILGVSGNQNGYIEDNNYIITWCVGHLLSMSYPEKYGEEYKSWNMDYLPFLPKDYLYEIIPGVKDQFKTVKSLMERKDISTIYYAGDSGREGQVIAELVRRNVRINSNVKELRVWIDSFTEDEIKRGIRDAKPMSSYNRLSEAGLMRGIEDYAMGINFSRALTLKYGRLLNLSGNKPVISVGRVMTCVLGMIVDREHEISAFVPTNYYTIETKAGSLTANWKVNPYSAYVNHPQLYGDNGFLDKQIASSLVNVGDKLTVSSVEVKKSKKNPPLLFNLAELQSKCSTIFHITPSQTLDIAQSLYEKGFTTYPRTDARVMSTAILCENANKIKALSSIYPEAAGVNPNIGKPYVDDSKITDHYAIIPTGKLPSGLSDLEGKVYDLIARRYLSIFFGPAEISKASATLVKDKETFLSAGAVITSLGYLAISTDKVNTDEDTYNVITSLNKGTVLNVDEVNIKDSKTMPPKRYTSGSIILAMENAGKLIEDEELRAQISGCGIGTSATRAGILEKLIDNDFLLLTKKTQSLSPTEKGEIVCEVVKQTIPGLLSPKMTASWEKGLAGIEQGNVTAPEFKVTLEKYVADYVNRIKQNSMTEQIVNCMVSNPAISINSKPSDLNSLTSMTEEDTGALCPVCGQPVMRRRYGNKEWFSCSAYAKDNSGCFFALSTFGIDNSQLAKAIKEGQTDELKLKSQKGKEFTSILKIEIAPAERKASWSFVNTGSETDFVCPKCHNKLLVNDDRYFCDCGFAIRKEVAGKILLDEDIKNLLEKGSTGVLTGFYSKKKRKRFNAELVFDVDYKTTFKF